MRDKDLLTKILQSEVNTLLKEVLIKEYLNNNFLDNKHIDKRCIDCDKPIGCKSTRCSKCASLSASLKQFASPESIKKRKDITKMIESGFLLQEVGDKYNVTRERIRQIYLKENGIPVKQVRKEQKLIKFTAQCVYCNKDYIKNRPDKIYCSKECRLESNLYKSWELRICRMCNLGFLIRRTGNRRGYYCSNKCKGKWFGQNYGFKKGSKNGKAL